jgi:hypothetical protein
MKMTKMSASSVAMDQTTYQLLSGTGVERTTWWETCKTSTLVPKSAEEGSSRMLARTLLI